MGIPRIIQRLKSLPGVVLLWDDITPKSWIRIGTVGKRICEEIQDGAPKIANLPYNYT